MNTKSLRMSLRTVFVVAEMSVRHTAVDGFVIFTVLIQPLLIALLALWMLQDKANNAIMFVIVGSGMTGLWSSLLFISGNSINIERWSGTLETLVGVPTSMAIIVLGKNLANVVQSLLSMVLSFALAALLFGYQIQIAQPLLFIASLFFTVIAFISFGLIIAPVFVLNPGVQHWQNGLEFPVYILSGFLFPIALLPGWTTPLSYLLPPYWAARALHATSQGGVPFADVAFSWAMMLFFSIVYFAVSNKLFERMLVKARRDATLEME